MSENRESIPEVIKRKVRQQCGFGCAICGMPFFQYDHIEEYADVREHTAENLVLLCPNHHSAKTTSKLSKARIYEAKLKPFNTDRTHTSGFKVEPSKKLVTLLGSNSITGWYPDGKGDHHPVWVNGKSFFIIHSDEGWLTVSLKVTDDKGNVLLSIQKGELIISTAAWDYVYEGENIKIRGDLSKIILDLKLSDTKVEVLRGIFLDKNLDGFIVRNDGALIPFIKGVGGSPSTGNICDSNGFGGYGLLNSSSAPTIEAPSGFGILYRS